MTILSIVIAVLMFGLLIAVHELGHFLAAKALGVRVNEFAIGMGPKLFSKQKGETVYSLRAFPVGGFCAMEGEEEASGDPRSFHNKPGWKKLIILAAGAFMNFVAGLIIILALFSQANMLSAPVVTDFAAGAEDLATTGLMPGDQFYRIDGHRIYFTSNASFFLGRAGAEVELTVLRGGEKVNLGTVSMPVRSLVDENGQTVQRRGINIGGMVEPTVGNKIRHALYQSADFVRMVWVSLGDLVTGAVGLKDLSGPIGIVTAIEQAGTDKEISPTPKAAVMNILNLVAFIAINLAVMNLLPIPALDGGQILFVLVDGVYHLISRRRIDQKYLGYINMAGFFLLIGLMVIVAISDVMKLF